MTLADDSPQALRYMIDHCTEYLQKLNSWETAFIEDVSDYLDRKGDLSPKQKDTLEKIYCRLP